jgi:trehalose 6-phosphate phosphatase
LPKVPGKLSDSEPGPAPLPENLLTNLLQRKPILLCLDYDGTISEIASEPGVARPVNGAIEALEVLTASRGRVATAVVTGRSIRDLRSMMPIPPGMAVAGVHGLEFLYPAGEIEFAHETSYCRHDLENARVWLEHNLPANCGFIVEDKGVALALHYRQVAGPVADSVRDSFERFLTECTVTLRARHGKMVIEALPKIASKGTAVRVLQQRVGVQFEPVYFGDDLTDEDAFRELGAHGISVLVGMPRPSAARYRIDRPLDVVRALELLAAAIGA